MMLNSFYTEPDEDDVQSDAEIDALQKVVTRCGIYTIKARDLYLLSPYQWLNDVIIGAYLSLIGKRSEENKALPTVRLFCIRVFYILRMNKSFLGLFRQYVFLRSMAEAALRRHQALVQGS